jgi:hypothetical protein
VTLSSSLSVAGCSLLMDEEKDSIWSANRKVALHTHQQEGSRGAHWVGALEPGWVRRG